MTSEVNELTLHTVTGNVKYSGVDYGSQNWKSGGLQIFQRDNGKTFCRMFFSTGNQKTFPLSNNIRRVISIASNPRRCLIQLKSGCNIVIDKGREPLVVKLREIVETLDSKKAPNGHMNGLKRSPHGAARNGQLSKSPSVKKVKSIQQSPRLFSQVGNIDQKSPISIEDFENEPITKLPLFSDVDDVGVDKENMGEVMLASSESGNKRTPYQMRKEEGGNIFLASCEEKLTLLKEKKNETNINPVARSFYGRGMSMSNYASVDNFKSYRSNLSKSPGPQLFSPSAKRQSSFRTFSFKPKTAAKFVSRNNLPQKTLQGFSNLGNTCYMNAILQSLYGLESLRNELVHSEASQNFQPESLSYAIKVLFIAKLQNKPRDVISKLLLRVKDAISKSATRFSGYLQHDAQEFLCQCMDQLNEDTQKLNKFLSEGMGNKPLPRQLKLSSPTSDNVEFTVVHTIRCLECGESITKEEMFHDLSLDMPKPSAFYPSTIQVALDKFFESEDISYSCEKCKGKQARLSHKFSKLSRYIILNLKRYMYRLDSSQNGKVQKEIEIPRYLTLSRHCMAAVEKPCNGEATPTDEMAMLLTSSPRRKLSFDAGDGGERRDKHVKRQRLDMDQKDALDENDQVVLISEADSEEEAADRDVRAMTEDEQLAYVLKLSQSEIKRKKGKTPLDLSPTVTMATQTETSFRGKVNSSFSEEKSPTKVHKEKNPDKCQIVPDGNIAISEPSDMADGYQTTGSLQTPVKVSMGMQSDGEGASLEGAEAVEITEIESDSSITPDAAAEEKEESLKSGENLSNPAKANKEEDVFSLPDSNLSREQLRAQEDEELRKATELSLLEQKDVALREEEEIRKAQELSLQEYEKQSPPLMIQEAVDDSPDRPLYSKEEWKKLKQNAREGDMPNSYQLVCVVSHIGSSLTMGHYVSDVFNSKSESWLSYDDSNVSVISGNQVREERKRTGYIFFYEKI
ncbi:ubiquitin carboxyl-terminal hydrolase 37-like isoform X2 [Apostichopus japonicus]|uniref:ubiquitin carboxyl-terminal hydrolase 37-like isoform X2 n=1 Tax=Stichopus japonicus TaxID=307972 RepID=UPI003AB89CDA